MKYNDLTDQGKEEIRQLLKVQFYKYFNEDVHGLLFEMTLKKLNPEVTLFEDLKVAQKVYELMPIVEEEVGDKDLLDNVDFLENGDILIKTEKGEGGFAATDNEKKRL